MRERERGVKVKVRARVKTRAIETLGVNGKMTIESARA